MTHILLHNKDNVCAPVKGFNYTHMLFPLCLFHYSRLLLMMFMLSEQLFFWSYKYDNVITLSL